MFEEVIYRRFIPYILINEIHHNLNHISEESEFSGRDRRLLRRTVTKNKKTTAAKAIAEMNVVLTKKMSMDLIRMELCKQKFKIIHQ